MTVLETLSEEKIKLIQDAQDKVTIEMLEDLDYGEDIELVEGVTLSHYCEDQIIVINLTKEWTEVLQVQWDVEGRKDIIFEAL